jgi:hypothetical protein
MIFSILTHRHRGWDVRSERSIMPSLQGIWLRALFVGRHAIRPLVRIALTLHEVIQTILRFFCVMRPYVIIRHIPSVHAVRY